MRRFFIILFLALLALTEAFGVDRNTAMRVARTVLDAGGTKGEGTTLTLLWNGLPETKANSEEDAPFYVFGKPDGGFAIVAGYEAVHPVLGYSLTDRFSLEQLPPQVRDFLDGMARVIISARERGMSPSGTISTEWEQYLYGQNTDEKEVVLKTAKWDQGDPYNMFCPLYNGERTVTGCTNTAAAIVMRYHRWPDAGVGDLPGYTSPFNQTQGMYIEGHSLGHKYDWDNMPEENLFNNENVSFYQQQQVAQLMYDLGIMNQSGYGYETSAALHVPEFVAHFNYDPSMQYVSRRYVPVNMVWESLIKDEIDSSRPVIYNAALSPNTAHAFVIDGYKGRLFHINFGWGGFSDAFMLVTPIDDQESDITFDIWGHQMYLGIRPNKTGIDTSIRVEYLEVSPDYDYEPNKTFYAMWQGRSFLLEDRTFRIAFCLSGPGEEVEEIISEPKDILIPSLGTGSFGDECIIKTQLRGDQSIRICYMDESGKWIVAPADIRGRFQLSYDHQLRSLSKLEYTKTDPNDVEWEFVLIRIPGNARFVLLDDNGARIDPIDYLNDVPVSTSYYYRDGYGNYIIKHKRGTDSHRYTVRIFDLIETVEFGVSL